MHKYFVEIPSSYPNEVLGGGLLILGILYIFMYRAISQHNRARAAYEFKNEEAQAEESDGVLRQVLKETIGHLKTLRVDVGADHEELATVKRNVIRLRREVQAAKEDNEAEGHCGTDYEDWAVVKDLGRTWGFDHRNGLVVYGSPSDYVKIRRNKATQFVIAHIQNIVENQKVIWDRELDISQKSNTDKQTIEDLNKLLDKKDDKISYLCVQMDEQVSARKILDEANEANEAKSAEVLDNLEMKLEASGTHVVILNNKFEALVSELKLHALKAVDSTEIDNLGESTEALDAYYKSRSVHEAFTLPAVIDDLRDEIRVLRADLVKARSTNDNLTPFQIPLGQRSVHNPPGWSHHIVGGCAAGAAPVSLGGLNASTNIDLHNHIIRSAGFPNCTLERLTAAGNPDEGKTVSLCKASTEPEDSMEPRDAEYGPDPDGICGEY